MHDLVIRNAQIVKSGAWQTTDIAIDAQRFSSFENVASPGKREIDATGLRCFPAGIDLHVHFNEPGRTHWEGFATGSLAAAAGGISFLAEMPLNSIPSTVNLDALAIKLDAIGSQSVVDFGLWGGLVPGNTNDLQELADAGVVGFKAFMSPSGTDDFANSDTSTLKAGMQEIAKTGKILALHAEDPKVLDTVSKQLSSKESAFDWEASRPIEAEISAIKIALELAGETGCRIHIVHVSNAEALEVIAEGKRQGIDVTCETCPHYLLLSIDDSHRIGPNAKCAPPLRPPQTVSKLWNSLKLGSIDTIGSDHSPSPPEMKSGAANYFQAWGGISGLQHGLPLLWSRAMNDPTLLEKIMELSSKNGSRLIGLEHKGSLEIGMDADFVLVKEAPTMIDNADLKYRHPYSAYAGLQTKVQVVETWMRGHCIFGPRRESNFPTGRFIRF